MFCVVSQAGDNEEPTPHVEGKDIDPTELLEVSAEHENRDTSAERPNNGLVNEITKQQMVVQFLKVISLDNDYWPCAIFNQA